MSKIVRQVGSLFALADQGEARLSPAERQMNAFTPSLLAAPSPGQLRPPKTPTDEPASALLERIRMERKKANDPRPSNRA